MSARHNLPHQDAGNEPGLDPALEAKIGRAAKLYLDASAGQLKQGTAYRLAEMRRNAVAAAQGETVAVAQGSLASNSGNSGFSFGGGWLSNWRTLALTSVLGLGAAFYAYQSWDMARRAADNAEIDAFILSNDAPLDAFFDKGFSQFLKSGEGQ